MVKTGSLTPLVKMTGKCAAGLAMQWSAEIAMNMYCMLIPYTEAVDESRGRAPPPLPRRLECAVIGKPIIAATASSGPGDSVVTGGGYR